MLQVGRQLHMIHPKFEMNIFLEAIYYRLNVLQEKLRTNEFSGKDITSMKSVMLQIAQNDRLTKVQKKIICLDILIAMEGK